jgi:hypothetical protein
MMENTMENEISVQDLISLSYEQKPLEFQNAFDSLLANRIAIAVDNRKMEIAQSMFNDQPQSEDYEESEQELDQEETSDGEVS